MDTSDISTTWDLSYLFSSDDDNAIERRRNSLIQKTSAFAQKWRSRNDYLRDPVALKEALTDFEEWARTVGGGGDIEFYFWLRMQQDSLNPELKAKYNQINELSTKLSNEVRFFALNLAKIPEPQQGRLLAHPLLKSYSHFLQTLFNKSKHMLEEEEEKILALKSQSAHENWVHMVETFLSKEEREVLTPDGKKTLKNFSQISSLLSNTNKQVRDSAAEAFNDILSKHKEVAEAEINSIILNKKVDDELRNLPRPDSARHLEDDIESEIVDALLDAVSRRFDIAQEYYNLKAKLFKVPKLQYHERNVPYGTMQKKYPYPEAVELVNKVFTQLDPQFSKLAMMLVANGQVDAFPKKGKRSGAFCTDGLLTHPIYVMLNHTDELRDVTTMAHEFGHGINSALMKLNQNALTYGTTLATAEVASTFMEDFVLQEVLKEADDELRLSLMVTKLDEDISTIFRQVACYKFEQELHATIREKGYLSNEEIGAIFQKHMSAYMGPAVEQSPGAQNWWVYWSHIRQFFYVYSYASGLLISKALQKKVKENPAEIAKVKEFLSAGLSDSPRNIFLKTGIDIADASFWQQGLAEIETLLKETEALAKKLSKLD